MYTTQHTDPTPAIITRGDGLAFEPDGIRAGWLRCRACLRLVLATKAAIDRHECLVIIGSRQRESEVTPC